MPHRSSATPSADALSGIDPLETLDAAGLAPIIKRKASTKGRCFPPASHLASFHPAGLTDSLAQD